MFNAVGDNGPCSTQLFIHGFADPDELSYPVIAGDGQLIGGEIIGNAVVLVDQTIKAVRLTSRSQAVIGAGKDAVGFTVTVPGGPNRLNLTVGRVMEIDDGGGGILVAQIIKTTPRTLSGSRRNPARRCTRGTRGDCSR